MDAGAASWLMVWPLWSWSRRTEATNAKAIVAVSIPRRWLGRSCTENKSGKSLVSLQGSLVHQARSESTAQQKTTVTQVSFKPYLVIYLYLMISCELFFDFLYAVSLRHPSLIPEPQRSRGTRSPTPERDVCTISMPSEGNA
jgi:hypothetical protein